MIQVPLPGRSGRIDILGVHLNGRSASVDLERVADCTAGWSGAELANLVNEGAIAAVRADRDEIVTQDLVDAAQQYAASRAQADFDPDSAGRVASSLMTQLFGKSAVA